MYSLHSAEDAMAYSSEDVIPVTVIIKVAIIKLKEECIWLKKVLEQLGLNSNRLRLEWISASEGKNLQTL